MYESWVRSDYSNLNYELLIDSRTNVRILGASTFSILILYFSLRISYFALRTSNLAYR